MRHSRPAAELAEAGQTPVAVAVNDQLRLLLGVADALRPDSPHGIRRLHGLGLETVLATGDTREAAATTARAGLRRYRHRRRRRLRPRPSPRTQRRRQLIRWLKGLTVCRGRVRV